MPDAANDTPTLESLEQAAISSLTKGLSNLDQAFGGGVTIHANAVYAASYALAVVRGQAVGAPSITQGDHVRISGDGTVRR